MLVCKSLSAETKQYTTQTKKTFSIYKEFNKADLQKETGIQVFDEVVVTETVEEEEKPQPTKPPKQKSAKPKEDLFNFVNLDTESVAAKQVIGQEVIMKRGNGNFLDSIKNTTGVDKQMDCSVCGSAGISLNNTPSRFATILVDGLPVYSSLGSTYGLDFTMANVSKVEISKGAGNAGTTIESMTGNVNIISKKPIIPEGQIRADIGNYGSRNASFFLGGPVQNADKTYVSVFGTLSSMNQIDNDNDNISEAPGFKRNSLGFQIFKDDLEGININLRFDSGSEKRHGGAVTEYPSAGKVDHVGNPFIFSNTTNGSTFSDRWIQADGSISEAWNSGKAGFLEVIESQRNAVSLVADKKTNDFETVFATAYVNNVQESFYSNTNYNAKQNMSFTKFELTYKPNTSSKITLGTNYRYEDLVSHSSILQQNYDLVSYDGVDNYDYRTLGLFGNYYLSAMGDRLQTNTSLLIDRPFVKFDNGKSLGWQFVPRFNSSFKHNDIFTSRFAAGTAYRLPTSFFETEHGILDVGSLKRNFTKPQRSFNASYTLSINPTDSLAINAGYNFTRLTNLAVTNITNEAAIFRNTDSVVTVQGVELNGSYDITPSLVISSGAEKYIYQFSKNNNSGHDLIFLSRPTEKLYAAIDYEFGIFDFLTQISWWGPQNLDNFYHERYNLDGTKKSNKSKSLIIWDAYLDIKITKNLSIYHGINNILNTTQIASDSFIFADDHGHLESTNIWGPNIGRLAYVGLKYTF